MVHNKYRLGLDLGTNSIGWALISLNQNLQPEGLIDLGSRIFSDGRSAKDKNSLAVRRREKRNSRRRAERLAQRKKTLFNELINCGLFPKASADQEKLKSLDVLKLRSEAVEKILTPYEVGRVLLHLSKKRGFQSGRKKNSEDEKKNKLTDRENYLIKQLNELNMKSYGQYLYKLSLEKTECDDQNEFFKKSTKATIENGFYPKRSLIHDEFNKIFEIQNETLKLSTQQIDKIKHIIFYQRPLAPVERGYCFIYHDKVQAADLNENKKYQRCIKSQPSYEFYRILCDLWNLKFIDTQFDEHTLSPEQIHKAFFELQVVDTKKIAALRKSLQIPTSWIVKNEICELKGASANSRLIQCFSKERQADLTLQMKDEVIRYLIDCDDEVDLKAKLNNLKLQPDEITNLLQIKSSQFSESTGSFCSLACQDIIDISIKEKTHPAKVVEQLMKKNSSIDQKNTFLKYYGEYLPEHVIPISETIKNKQIFMNEDERKFGKISNPTVHIGLNQLRIVFNELVKKYGIPESIHIEFARDLKNSKEKRQQIERKQKHNQKIDENIKEILMAHDAKLSHANFEKMRLWNEVETCLNKKCIYCGRQLSLEMVLTEQVEIDHIIPFSISLDNSFANKVLVCAEDNRKKGIQTPAQFFEVNYPDQWEAIQERAIHLHENKRNRFSKNYLLKHTQMSFLSRQLSDTSYLANIAKKYMGTVVDSNKISVLSGCLTSMVRGKLGLNQILLQESSEIDRTDYRYHAIDAIVIALIDPSFLQKMAFDIESHSSTKLKIETWENSFQEIKLKIQSMKASIKVDHGKNGELVEETCYGLNQNIDFLQRPENKDYKLKIRKDVRANSESQSLLNQEKISAQRIIDLKMRDQFQKNLINKSIKKVKVYEVCNDKINFINSEGLKKSDAQINYLLDKKQFLTSDESTIVIVHHGNKKQHLKVYKKSEINHLSIWKIPNQNRPIFKVIYTYDLNAKDYNQLKPHPAAKLISKIYKRDTVAIEINNQIEFFKVDTIKNSSSQLGFLPINKAKKMTNEKAFLKSFSKLSEIKFRKIYMSPTGKIYDHGPILE